MGGERKRNMKFDGGHPRRRVMAHVYVTKTENINFVYMLCGARRFFLFIVIIWSDNGNYTPGGLCISN